MFHDEHGDKLFGDGGGRFVLHDFYRNPVPSAEWSRWGLR
jgi:hypothetical protein